MNKITKITTNLQDADKSSAVFYRITSMKAVSIFWERFNKSNAGLVYLEIAPDIKIEDNERIIKLTSDGFETKKQTLINEIYPNWKKPKVIGITGTNGKSSIVHFLQQILNNNGHSAISIGTVGIIKNDKIIIEDLGSTTPSEVDLKRLMHEFSDNEYICLEVSSHALDQKRVSGINFECAGFTNLTQDHLDYHQTMENYLEAKLKILAMSKNLIIPPGEDDLEKTLIGKKINFKVAKKIETKQMNECFHLSYNIKNISLACEIIRSVLGNNDFKYMNVNPPKGRFTTIKNDNAIYVVDYAHTPDAILNLVSESRKSFKDYKIITMFGCGGDRDRLKRPKMLSAALTNSDEVIVTTDNPRTEEPTRIINDIVCGNENNNKIKIVEDREEAIRLLVKKYSQKTLVLIAGKGHEEYQEVKGVKNHFSDIEMVNKYIEKII